MSVKNNYRISVAAAKDLESIWLYTFENWSKEQADLYIGTIINEIEHIAANPSVGADYSNVRAGYFRARVRSHFLFYRINTKQKHVEIIRVLHRMMDVNTHLDV